MEPKLPIEDVLGPLTLEGKQYKVQLPDGKTYIPQYTINPDDLRAGAYVGHIVMFEKPMLMISRVILLTFSEVGAIINWPKLIKTEPVMHSWDERSIEELPVTEFELTIDTLQCIFKPDVS